MPRQNPPKGLHLPEGFITLLSASLTKDEAVSVIGVVQGFTEPKPTKGNDWILTLDLQDKSFTNTILAGHPDGEVLPARIFKPKSELPPITGIGDIIIMRNARMRKWGGTFWLMSYFKTEIIAIPAKTIPDPAFQIGYGVGSVTLKNHRKPHQAREITGPEQLYAIGLHHALPAPRKTPSTEPEKDLPIRNKDVEPSTTSGKQGPVTSGRERVSIKDLQPNKFVDLAAEVVKIHSDSFSTELYVSDYTTNDALYLYLSPEENKDLPGGENKDGDLYGYAQRPASKWEGPFGKMTINIKLWGANVAWTSSNLHKGDLVYLRNLHVKHDKSGGKLEGAIHEDRKYPDRVDISKLAEADLIQTIKERQQAYLHSRASKDDAPAMTKAQKSRAKKKRQKKGKNTDDGEKPQTEAPIAKGTDEVGASNAHVRCGYAQIKLSSVSSIINKGPAHEYKTPKGVKYTLPFVNAKYRARLRVVDYKPDDLRDFAQCLDDPDYNDKPDSSQPSSNPSGLSSSPSGWEWAFCLLVQDAEHPAGVDMADTIQLLVHGKHAEGLLKIDAVDLRKNKKALGQLKEKLFLMWGNLEELKEKGHDPFNEATFKIRSDKPFEACIQEYGTEVDEAEADELEDKPDPNLGKGMGWQRRFQMFGTTIMD